MGRAAPKEMRRRSSVGANSHAASLGDGPGAATYTMASLKVGESKPLVAATIDVAPTIGHGTRAQSRAVSTLDAAQ